VQENKGEKEEDEANASKSSQPLLMRTARDKGEEPSKYPERSSHNVATLSQTRTQQAGTINRLYTYSFTFVYHVRPYSVKIDQNQLI
jgi:hypothetical protein